MRIRPIVARRLLVPALLGVPLLCAAVAIAAQAPVKGGHYTGATGGLGSTPVSFSVSASGKSILSFTTRLGYNGKCGQGGGPGYEIKVATIPLRGGRFSASTKGTLPGTAVAVKPVTVKVSGRIVGRSASGSVVEPGAIRCKAPHKGVNPYAETFTARVG